MQFDGEIVTGLYSLDDRLMKHNLIENNSQLSTLNFQLQEMELELKAIIQQYMERITENRLIPDTSAEKK
jgi:hypothetical protein